MNISDFTSHRDIQDGIRFLKNIKVSDVVDAQGRQYVDLVQEGGGVLGIALVGYTYVLEQLGIRFFSLAGTSAGAINAMLIAGLGGVKDPKSEKILELLVNQDLFNLVDGHSAIKRIIQKAIRKERGLGLSLALNAFRLYRILKSRMGLNPGTYFEQWIEAALAGNGVKTLSDLERLRRQMPEGLRHTGGEPVNDLVPKLAIIASDITTHSKVEFPRMADLYWASPGDLSPAKLVRASMAIPFFFEPFVVRNIPNAGKQKDPRWDECTRYTGEAPNKALFVDGGLLSNFPINVFHRSDGSVPRMPTFGVRLSAYRQTYSKTSSMFSFAGAMVSTMRQIYDYDFILKNPDYRKLICRIDADQRFNWLDFNLGYAHKIDLFRLGAAKALTFLSQFDWEEYKLTRKRLSDSGALNR